MSPILAPDFLAFLHETTSDLKTEKKSEGHALVLENQDVLHEMTSEYKKHLHEITSDYTASSLEKQRKFRGRVNPMNAAE